MDCDEYQRPALRTAREPDAPNEFIHLVLGLVGESGEIAEKVKKLIRDKNSDLAQLDRDDMAAEFGDVLWYAAVLASFLGLSTERRCATKRCQALRSAAPGCHRWIRRQPLSRSGATTHRHRGPRRMTARLPQTQVGGKARAACTSLSRIVVCPAA